MFSVQFESERIINKAFGTLDNGINWWNVTFTHVNEDGSTSSTKISVDDKETFDKLKAFEVYEGTCYVKNSKLRLLTFKQIK